MGRFKQVLTVGLSSLLVAVDLWAAPFDKDMRFTQPDGSVIQIHGRGDEFYAEFTHAGYPIVAINGAYYYAVLTADGSKLVSSGRLAGSVDPSTVPGLDPNARISRAARIAQVKRSEERRVGKECELKCRSRWSPYH